MSGTRIYNRIDLQHAPNTAIAKLRDGTLDNRNPMRQAWVIQEKDKDALTRDAFPGTLTVMGEKCDFPGVEEYIYPEDTVDPVFKKFLKKKLYSSLTEDEFEEIYQKLASDYNQKIYSLVRDTISAYLASLGESGLITTSRCDVDLTLNKAGQICLEVTNNDIQLIHGKMTIDLPGIATSTFIQGEFGFALEKISFDNDVLENICINSALYDAPFEVFLARQDIQNKLYDNTKKIVTNKDFGLITRLFDDLPYDYPNAEPLILRFNSLKTDAEKNEWASDVVSLALNDLFDDAGHFHPSIYKLLNFGDAFAGFEKEKLKRYVLFAYIKQLILSEVYTRYCRTMLSLDADDTLSKPTSIETFELISKIIEDKIQHTSDAAINKEFIDLHKKSAEADIKVKKSFNEDMRFQIIQRSHVIQKMVELKAELRNFNSGDTSPINQIFARIESHFLEKKDTPLPPHLLRALYLTHEFIFGKIKPSEYMPELSKLKNESLSELIKLGTLIDTHLKEIFTGLKKMGGTFNELAQKLNSDFKYNKLTLYQKLVLTQSILRLEKEFNKRNLTKCKTEIDLIESDDIKLYLFQSLIEIHDKYNPGARVKEIDNIYLSIKEIIDKKTSELPAGTDAQAQSKTYTEMIIDKINEEKNDPLSKAPLSALTKALIDTSQFLSISKIALQMGSEFYFNTTLKNYYLLACKMGKSPWGKAIYHRMLILVVKEIDLIESDEFKLPLLQYVLELHDRYYPHEKLKELDPIYDSIKTIIDKTIGDFPIDTDDRRSFKKYAEEVIQKIDEEKNDRHSKAPLSELTRSLIETSKLVTTCKKPPEAGEEWRYTSRINTYYDRACAIGKRPWGKIIGYSMLGLAAAAITLVGAYFLWPIILPAAGVILGVKLAAAAGIGVGTTMATLGVITASFSQYKLFSFWHKRPSDTLLALVKAAKKIAKTPIAAEDAILDAKDSAKMKRVKSFSDFDRKPSFFAEEPSSSRSESDSDKNAAKITRRHSIGSEPSPESEPIAPKKKK